MIEIRELAKYFGKITALRGIDLSVKSGEFLALFGRNGAGKTSLLRILAGLSRPSSGAVSIQESESTGPQAGRRAIGYLSHNTALYFDLTALENLGFYARLMDLHVGDGVLLQKIEQVGLAGREHEPVRHYSRGMQQRLAIARAFLHDPGILLLDEPFTGLDQAGADFLAQYLVNAHADGKTCIMAIHDTELGYQLANRLIVIEKGMVALDIPKSYLSLNQFREKYKVLAGS
jgi:heme exporter protein A